MPLTSCDKGTHSTFASVNQTTWFCATQSWNEPHKLRHKDRVSLSPNHIRSASPSQTWSPAAVAMNFACYEPRLGIPPGLRTKVSTSAAGSPLACRMESKLGLNIVFVKSPPASRTSDSGHTQHVAGTRVKPFFGHHAFCTPNSSPLNRRVSQLRLNWQVCRVRS